MTTSTHPFDEKRVLEVEGTGSIVEAGGGLAVIVLSIIGLAGANASFMVSIAGIALGAALLAEGGAIAGEYSKLLSLTTEGRFDAAELGGGMTTELIAGGAALVLGILGLLRLAPLTLLPIAVITVGAALMLTSGAVQRLNDVKVRAMGLSETARKVTHAAVSSAAGAQLFTGVAAIVLGIIALTASPATAGMLTLVGLLALGASVTLSGSALAGRLLRAFGR